MAVPEGGDGEAAGLVDILQVMITVIIWLSFHLPLPEQNLLFDKD